MKQLTDYPFEIKPLGSDDGGGFLISYPDFAECVDFHANLTPSFNPILPPPT